MNPLSLFLDATGRIGQKQFIIGVVGIILYGFFGQFMFSVLDKTTMLHFWFGLIYFCLFIYIFVVIFGKRLHDMGRSYWMLTSFIMVIFITLLIMMLASGGAEYFDAFSQFERKEAIDPDVVQGIMDEYQARMAEHLVLKKTILSTLAGGFTLWLALTKPKNDGNPYKHKAPKT